MKFTFRSRAVKCPACEKTGNVWYLVDRTEYEAQCANCGYLFKKGEKPVAVTDWQMRQCRK